MEIIKQNNYIYFNCLDMKKEDINHLKHFLLLSYKLKSYQTAILMKSNIADIKIIIFDSHQTEIPVQEKELKEIIKILYEKKIVRKQLLTIENSNTIYQIERESMDIGRPNISARSIPIMTDKNVFINQKIQILDEEYSVTCLSFEDSHTIVFLKDIDHFPVEKLGFYFESYRQFPERTNVEFAEVIEDNAMKVRMWKKGVGETIASEQAIGAVLVASVWNHYLEKNKEIKVISNKENISTTYLENEHVIVQKQKLKRIDKRL